MIYVTIAILTAILAVATYTAIWSRKLSNARLLSLLLFAPLLGIGVLSVLANLGAPTACYSGWTIPNGKLKVLGFKVIKDEVIYLMLDTPDAPTLCSIPYTDDQAEGLQDGKEGGYGSEVSGEGGPMAALGIGDENDPKPTTVHPAAPMPNPPKPEEDDSRSFGE